MANKMVWPKTLAQYRAMGANGGHELWDILRKYAAHFYPAFQKRGVSVDFEELVGEFGLAYTRAEKTFVEGGAAQFSTYPHTCFRHRVSKLYEYQRRHRCEPYVEGEHGVLVPARSKHTQVSDRLSHSPS